jgi:Bacterial Ig domain/Fibronectin type III domain
MEGTMRVYVVLIILGLVLGWWLPLQAATINLAWDRVASADTYRIYYGTVAGLPNTVVDVGAAITASIAGLTEGERYYFVATAVNGAGESPYSNEVEGIATTPQPPDTTPPTVVITVPADGVTVPRKSLVTLTAEANDDRGVQQVQFTVNAQIVCPAALHTPYTCAWEVPAPPRRTYTLRAMATDLAGNTGLSGPIQVSSQ